MIRVLLILLVIMFSVKVQAQITLHKGNSFIVTLTWQAPTNQTDPVVGYNVYRSYNSLSYDVINSSEVIVTNFTDALISPSITYSWYVTSLDAKGNESNPSNTVSASVPWVPSPVLLGKLGAT